MLGALAIVVVLILVAPVAVMMGGALWSGLVGEMLTRDADHHADGTAG